MRDATDRVQTTGLAQVRASFAQSALGLGLMGMPGLATRLSRSPPLSARVGCVHAFRPLSTPAVRPLFPDQ